MCLPCASSTAVGMGSVLKLLAVAALVVAAVPSVSSTSPSTASLVSSTPSTTFLTENQCEDHPVQQLNFVERSKIPHDCRCPPGFAAVRVYQQTNKALCVGIRSAGPWQDGCVRSGTATDYYDLDLTDLVEVRQLLHRLNVSECWISARRLLKYGELVRRLPGTRWNTPVELPNHSHLLLPVSDYNKNHDCATVRIDQQSDQLSYQNCSATLPQICIYREASLLQLHCETNEYTTRYSSHQRYCFSLRKSSLNMVRMLRLAMTAKGNYSIDNNRKVQLLIEMYDASKNCSDSLNFIYADRKDSTHHAHKRDTGDNKTMPNRDIIPIASPDPNSFACIAHQRLQIENDTLVTTDGTGPGMYLHFDKARHKLFLTVYGDRWFWREDPSTNGFVCFTNVNDEQLYSLRVKKLRSSHVKWDKHASNASSFTADRRMYEVKLEEYGPPRPYWCEAHLVPDFALIKTDTVLAQRKANCRRYFSATIELLLTRASTNPPDTLRLKDYDRIIGEYVKNRHKQLPELKHIFEAIKSIHVKRMEDFWTSATNDWYTVRLVLHIVTKCAKKWDKLLQPESNEIELPAQYLDYYQMHRSLTTALESLRGEGFRFIGTNSTEYCLPESLQLAKGKNVWWPARLGETVAPRNLCLIEVSGLPVTRRCLGDYLYGCAWDWNPGSELCSNQKRPTTDLLYRYSVSQLNQSVLGDVLHKTSDVLAIPENVIPADLFYISKTLENMPTLFEPDTTVSEVRDDPNRYAYFCNISNILSRVMYLNETTVVQSQRALNTTNILLDATETIVNQLALANDTVAMMQGEQYNCQAPGSVEQLRRNDGTVLFRTARLIVLIADPTVANVTGLALFRNRKPEDLSDGLKDDEQEDFSDYRLRYLYMNQSIEALLMESDLEIGSFIPQHVIESLDELNDAFATTEEEEDPDTVEVSTTPVSEPQDPLPNPTPLRIIVTVYYNDHAFRETKNGTIARPISKIISVNMPGYGSRMPDEIPIYTREHAPNRPGRCGYWSFDADNSTEFGHWSYDECRLLNSSGTLSLCGCFHLTSFSRLTKDIQMVETVGVSQKLIADKGTLALDIITAIGCSMSLLGVVGIFATAALFPAWRAKASSKILLQLSCAIAIEMIIIFLEGPDIDQNRISQIECALLGAIFHYIILVTFMWMLITAYLQFMRYVKVLGRLRPSHFILKATVCCWGGPLLVVSLFLSLDYTLYLKRDNLSDICYPHGTALWYGLLLPIGLIIFVNLISFVIVMYHIFTIPNNLTKTADHAMTLAQLRLSVFLFFLLGLPWIFGMLTTGTEDKLFAYLFCLTAPIQGFVLFVYFVIMDPTARRFWYRKLQHLPCVTRTDKQVDGEHTTSPNTSFNTYL
uniref:G-protein coupled receptors family 2 profile 2 domain-containing protein n=1 Tax=Anopheles minimus TaxID=112268 RepID=A0A182W434_9DIPT